MRFLRFALVVASAFIPSAAFCEDAALRPATASAEDVELSIAPTEAEFPLGSPIIMIARLRNIGSAPGQLRDGHVAFVAWDVRAADDPAIHFQSG